MSEAFCVECGKIVKVYWEKDCDFNEFNHIVHFSRPKCSLCGEEILTCLDCQFWVPDDTNKPLRESPYGYCQQGQVKRYNDLACQKFEGPLHE